MSTPPKCSSPLANGGHLGVSSPFRMVRYPRQQIVSRFLRKWRSPIAQPTRMPLTECRVDRDMSRRHQGIRTFHVHSRVADIVRRPTRRTHLFHQSSSESWNRRSGVSSALERYAAFFKVPGSQWRSKRLRTLRLKRIGRSDHHGDCYTDGGITPYGAHFT